jgi:amidophosphoribosyltransferase
MKDEPYGDGMRDLFPGETIYMKNHEIIKSAIVGLENVFWSNGKGRDVKTFDVNESLGELINSMSYVDSEGLVYDGLLPEFVCGFGSIYYNSPAANNHQVSCIRFRARLGRYLSPVPESIDHENIVVIPVPDSGRAAASGYANQYNYKLREGLIKAVKRRSYTIYDKETRDELAEIKYLVVPGAFHDGKKGKAVVFLDDSIVRGTTVYRLIVKAFEAGASKVFFKASSPPLKYFCPFGDDMRDKVDLIAIEKDMDEIYEEVFDLCSTKINKNYSKGIYSRPERDYVLSKINKKDVNIEYQKIDDLLDCFDSFFVNKKQRICLGCITGEFPYKP